MAKTVEFYTISLQSENRITDCSIETFIEDISKQMFSDEAEVHFVRKVNERYIRLFPFLRTMNNKQIVIPFGKLKDRNKPYWINSEDELEEFPQSLYDINSLGYDADYNVMLYTTNREGPSIQNVERYLNTFIPKKAGVLLKIEPIMYNTGIEKIRNAQMVRSITLTLDLGQAFNNFYLNEIDINNTSCITSAFKKIAETARDDGNSKSLSLTMGVGKGSKKFDSLNIQSILFLLEQINIDADCVKEITVNYKNGIEDKVDVAKLKNTQMLLFYKCKCDGTQVSPIDLINNINNAVADRVLEIRKHLREYFYNIEPYNGDEISIVTKWDNNAY